jgi:hypothetical protein
MLHLKVAVEEKTPGFAVDRHRGQLANAHGQLKLSVN